MTPQRTVEGVQAVAVGVDVAADVAGAVASVTAAVTLHAGGRLRLLVSNVGQCENPSYRESARGHLMGVLAFVLFCRSNPVWQRPLSVRWPAALALSADVRSSGDVIAF